MLLVLNHVAAKVIIISGNIKFLRKRICGNIVFGGKTVCGNIIFEEKRISANIVFGRKQAVLLPLSVRMAAELGIVITTVASDFGANEIRE